MARGFFSGSDAAPRRVPLSYRPEDDGDLLLACRDRRWRLLSGQIYRIMTKGSADEPGSVKPFIPNAAQRRFLANLHHRNVILKARQLGFTTLISILWLDHALFTPHQRCGIVAHNLEDAQVIFRDKVRFAYEGLPLALQRMFPTGRESSQELLFERSNSSIRVATSMRSGTIHRLHVSEMGKIAAKEPAKAEEIVTGSLPAVPAAGVAVIESTAEGQQGEFYDLANRAEARSHIDRPLGRHEWAFHFFPWWSTPEYVADPREVFISAEDHAYFDRVEAETGSMIRLPQRAWYVAKREFEQNGDAEKMWREYPSTSSECWQQSTEGAYFARQIMRARVEGRIGPVPHVTHAPVHTFWDIGAGDGTGVWCMQHVGVQHRFIWYLEAWSEGYEYFVRRLRDTGWLFGSMYLPHDVTQTRQVKDTVASPLDILSEIAPDWDWRVVPRTQEKQHAIELARARLAECWFDENHCAEGIKHLELYRKKWNARMGAWSDEPEKLAGHSEAADAFMQFAQGFDPKTARNPGRAKREDDLFSPRSRRGSSGGGGRSVRRGLVV